MRPLLGVHGDRDLEPVLQLLWELLELSAFADLVARRSELFGRETASRPA